MRLRAPDARSGTRAITSVVIAACALAALSSGVHADDTTGRVIDAPVSTRARPLYVRPFVTLAAGGGFRFNNPYRLSTPLGESAESISATAPYSSVGAGAAFGAPFGFQHGPVLRWDRSLRGVTQHVLVPSYGAFRRGAVLGGWSRLGFPILLAPDANVGIELSVGAAWYVLAGVGITAEVLGDLFWGAATPDNRRAAYPILSGQLGVIVEWERLP